MLASSGECSGSITKLTNCYVSRVSKNAAQYNSASIVFNSKIKEQFSSVTFDANILAMNKIHSILIANEVLFLFILNVAPDSLMKIEQ